MTAREVRFANHYLEHGNKTAAARHAGYQGSDPVLCQTGTNLLKKNEVVDYIREAFDQFADTEKITRQRVLQSLGREAFADRTRILDEDGDVLPPGEWPLELRAMLVSFEMRKAIDRDTGDTVRIYKVRLTPPTEAKRLLAEHLHLIGPHAEKPGSKDTGPSINIILEAADGTQTEFPDDGLPLEVPAAG